MEQRIAQGGAGVQIEGNNNTVMLFAGATRLVLDRRHLAKAAPETERDLLLTERRATDLVGRDDDLGALDAWLSAPRPITCRCLTGRGGTGKTRLAIELCERAEAAGWVAGFARHEELQRFFNQQNLADWRWTEKTLVVVDYAAASASVLRTWLAVLARRPACDKPLRLLLLERHADPQAGWWPELVRPGGLSGAGPDALLDPAEPIPLAPLARVEERRALLAQAMREAARVRQIASPPVLPPPGADADFERRLADDTINNEPLYLLMAGLVAVTTGAPTALTFSRIDLALRVADAERDRLDRLAGSEGIDRSLFRHLAACITLQGGCTVEAATRLVNEERTAIGEPITIRADKLVSLLAAALPMPGSGDIDAVRPDLIGEALLWQQIAGDRQSLDQQCAIVGRAYARVGKPLVTTVIHAAQDLAEGSAAHPTVAWLDHLSGTVQDVATLTAIAGEIPQYTLALRERAAEITARIVEKIRANVASDPVPRSGLAALLARLLHRRSGPGHRPDLARQLNNLSVRLSDLGRREEALAAVQEAVDIDRALAAARPDAFRPDLAMSLHTLSNRLSDPGRREEALAAIQEAVDIRRALAAARPDAFRPDLATSLWVLADRLDEKGDLPGGVAANAEAIGVLAPQFLKLPTAFAGQMAGMVEEYVQRCEKVERAPDEGLLAPILAAFESLQQEEESPP